MFGPCARCELLTIGKINGYYNDLSTRCEKTGVSVYFNINRRMIPGVYHKQSEKEQLAIEHLEELGVGCSHWQDYDGTFTEEWVEFPKYKVGDVLRINGSKIVRLLGQKVKIVQSEENGCNNQGLMCYIHYYKTL